ncbi:formamidopyrimidine-DNA glycosylase-like [Zingiber officinale]|uniref:formamidopyrimidine-DNA glycosylase-like n=1 Tax=Zingiber officinale TaxID=94328 RepID=UPI001C4BB248|nr:formamidopyrimidine-DNA glycosylase-like [Zingiber officinale]
MPPFPCSDWEESENTRSGKGRPRRMPELPEVEVARRAIEEHCVGKRIVQCSVADDPKVIDGVTPSDLESALVGKTIVAALRKGKNLWLRLDSPPFPTFQFGMAGAIYIKGVTLTKYKRSAVSDADEWPSTYSKVLLKLDDGLELSFTDKRRFARVRLLEDPKSVAPISELGPDALLGLMPIDAFMASLSKKKIAIKALLLDQSYISGIGNWIADEVLYQAKIHPNQIASSLSRESCKALHNCIKEVIEKALEVGADSSQFSQDWIFHSREKKPGNAFVAGKKIEFITVGGRTSAYVPELQKLTANQLEEASYKKSAKTRSIKNVDKEESTSEKEESNKISKKTKDPKRQAKKTGETKNTSSSGKGKTQKQDESALGSLKKRKESNQAETRQKKAKK